MVQESRRHHFSPVFYLSAWATDGRVCEYTRPHRVVVARMKAPGATGFQRELYTALALPAGSQRMLEDGFLNKVDQIASDALAVMLDAARGPASLPPRLRDGWSRFILSLQYRSPAKLAALKQRYGQHVAESVPAYRELFEARRDPRDGRTFEEFCGDLRRDAEEKSWTRLFLRVVDSRQVGDFLNGMLWNVLTVTGSDRKFLTSDHPVVMTNGLDRPDGHLVLPVGPSKLFVATTNSATLEAMKRNDVRGMQREVNDRVVRQAHASVYGEDESQRGFIEDRLRRRP